MKENDTKRWTLACFLITGHEILPVKDYLPKLYISRLWMYSSRSQVFVGQDRAACGVETSWRDVGFCRFLKPETDYNAR